MIKGLAHLLLHVPVQAGTIVAVFDHGCRLHVATRPDYAAAGHVEIALSRGMATLKRPKVGDVLVEWPTGHLEIYSAEAFAQKALAGAELGIGGRPA